MSRSSSSSSTEEAFRHTMRGPSPSRSTTKPSTSSKPDKSHKAIAPASPSASILLISPTNRILLLHRVQHSTSFASAHVFPGGHLSPQDGPLPPADDVRRHEDSFAYRYAAIRECFEESGLLLATRQDRPGELVDLSEQERDEGRRAVHEEKVPFRQWVEKRGGVVDVDGLVPFTRWLTPGDLSKRFSTQMYLYFLPMKEGLLEGEGSGQMHIPTPDGGVEHTAARFLYPREWIELALAREIVLFPPQFFLLSLIAPFLSEPPEDTSSAELSTEQRERLMRFVKEDGNPPWGEKCISPNPIKKTGKYLICGMENAGPELEGTQRKGDPLRVLRVELAKDKERGRPRPEPQEVVWREDVLGEEKTKL